jgi:hypothetical protein
VTADEQHSEAKRATFLVRLKAEPGCCHPIHALRRLLKYALRSCGLRAGTVAEIGAAYALHKPIFIAFADEQLSKHFYFVKQPATVAVIAPDVMRAWELFARWSPSAWATT